METGASSIDSPPSATISQRLQKSLEQDLDVDQDIVQLGKMVGLKSLHRNLKSEDAAVEADFRAHHAMTFEGQQMPESRKRDDEMDIMVAHGDVHIYEQPKEPKQQAPVPVTPTQPDSPTQPSSLARNAALAAALFGAGAVPGALTAYMLTRPNEQQPAVYNGKDFELGLGEPGKPILPLNNEGTP